MPKRTPTKRLATKKKRLTKKRATKQLSKRKLTPKKRTTKQLSKRKLTTKKQLTKRKMTTKKRTAKQLTKRKSVTKSKMTAKKRNRRVAVYEPHITFDKLREMSIRTDRQISAQGKQIAELGRDIAANYKSIVKLKETVAAHDRKWGELTEALTIGDARELFAGMGFVLQKMGNNLDLASPDGKIAREIDGLASGKDTVVVMEAKTSLTVRDVEKFIKNTLMIFTEIDQDSLGKKIYGAVGYFKASQQAIALAHKKGLFVIRSRHENKELVEPPRGFRPHNFHP